MFPQRRVLQIHIPRLVVAAIAVSSVFLSLYLSVTNAVVGSAPLIYVQRAAALLPWLAGKGDVDVGNPVAPVHPLYGVGTLMMSVFVGEIDLAGTLVSSLSWAATLPLFFFVCRKLYGVKVAYLSTALLSTNKWMIHQSYEMLPEALYVLLSVSSLLACVHLVELLGDGNSRVCKRLLILSSSTGCLLALLYLSRVEGTAVVLSVLAFLCLWSIVRRRTDVGVAAGMAIVTFLVILLPYPLSLEQYGASWVNSEEIRIVKLVTRNLAMPGSGSSFRMTYLRTGYQYVETYSQILGSVGKTIIALLGIMTILPPIRLSEVRTERLLPVLFLSPLAVRFGLEYATRFAVPYLFILIMWVGAGAIQVGQRLGKRHASLAIATVLIAISIFSSRDVRSWPHSHVHLTMKDVGLWMKDNLAARDLEGETILGRRGALVAAFYAGKLKVSYLYRLGLSRPEQFVEYMKAKNIRYLLVDALYTVQSHPDLALLLSDFEAARNLGLDVLRVEQGRTNTSVLYELRSVKDVD